MDIAMANSRPETEDGWKDGWTYSYANSFEPYQSTAWTTPISLPFAPPFTLKISGTDAVQTELKFCDSNGNIIDRWSLYTRTVDLTNANASSFVFCCPVEWKKTLKIEDITHNVVLFENGMPWTELEK